MSRLFLSPDTDWVGRVAWAAGEDQVFEHLTDPDIELNDVVHAIERNDVQVVIIGPGLDTADAATLVRYLSDNWPALEIVQWVESDHGAILGALRNGATDVATAELTPEEVAATVQRLEDRTLRRWEANTATVDENEHHRVVVVASPRGGVGRTTIACALGHLLDAEGEGDAALVDLDLQCGDVADVFGLAPN